MSVDRVPGVKMAQQGDVVREKLTAQAEETHGKPFTQDPFS